MNWYSIFYWLTVGDKFSELFVVGIVLFSILFLIAAVAYVIQTWTDSSEFSSKGEESREEAKARVVVTYRNSMLSIGFVYFLLWAMYIAIPSRKEALFIIAGGGVANFATQDSSMRQIPAELSNFVLTGLRNLSMEEGIQLLQGDTKEKALEEAKQLTGAQLIEKMRNDTTFAKLITQ